MLWLCLNKTPKRCERSSFFFFGGHWVLPNTRQHQWELWSKADSFLPVCGGVDGWRWFNCLWACVQIGTFSVSSHLPLNHTLCPVSGVTSLEWHTHTKGLCVTFQSETFMCPADKMVLNLGRYYTEVHFHYFLSFFSELGVEVFLTEWFAPTWLQDFKGFHS